VANHVERINAPHSASSLRSNESLLARASFEVADGSRKTNRTAFPRWFLPCSAIAGVTRFFNRLQATSRPAIAGLSASSGRSYRSALPPVHCTCSAKFPREPKRLHRLVEATVSRKEINTCKRERKGSMREEDPSFYSFLYAFCISSCLSFYDVDIEGLFASSSSPFLLVIIHLCMISSSPPDLWRLANVANSVL